MWIYTPYLIVDDAMLQSLCLAAKRGVDVRIVTPGIPDKKVAYWLTQSNYSVLLQAGVKILQYTPGFIHAKTLIADGKTAVIGTINFDFRSFYLHFESAAVLYECSMIEEMVKDYRETLDKSHMVTEEECRKRPLYKKAAGSLLNIFAPLL